MISLEGFVQEWPARGGEAKEGGHETANSGLGRSQTTCKKGGGCSKKYLGVGILNHEDNNCTKSCFLK